MEMRNSSYREWPAGVVRSADLLRETSCAPCQCSAATRPGHVPPSTGRRPGPSHAWASCLPRCSAAARPGSSSRGAPRGVDRAVTSFGCMVVGQGSRFTTRLAGAWPHLATSRHISPHLATSRQGFRDPAPATRHLLLHTHRVLVSAPGGRHYCPEGVTGPSIRYRVRRRIQSWGAHRWRETPRPVALGSRG